MKPFLLFFTLFLSTIAHAENFQCITAAGKIIISDTPCQRENVTFSQHVERLIEALRLKIKNYLSPEKASSHPKLKLKNLLKNAAFENKLTDWHIPQDVLWSTDKGLQQSSALSIQAIQPPDNKYIYETKVTQCVILGAGSQFKLSAHFFTSTPPLKAHANRANVIWYESTDCSTGGQWGSYIEPDPQQTGWQKLKGRSLTPALGAKAAMISIVQNGRFSAGGIAYWDNINFAATEITSPLEPLVNKTAYDELTLDLGVNYLSNSEFNTTINNWHAPQNAAWSESQGESSLGSAKVTVSSSTGSRGEHAISQCVNFGEHRIFKLGASYKKEEESTQTGGGRLRLIWYGQQNCHGAAKIDPNWTDPKNLSGWQKLHISGLTAPKNAHSAKVDIIQSISGAGQFTLYWDNIYFIAIQ